MITVSGHVYDVYTGLVTTVVPAAPMPSAARGARMSTRGRGRQTGRTPDV